MKGWLGSSVVRYERSEPPVPSTFGKTTTRNSSPLRKRGIEQTTVHQQHNSIDGNTGDWGQTNPE